MTIQTRKKKWSNDISITAKIKIAENRKNRNVSDITP